MKIIALPEWTKANRQRFQEFMETLPDGIYGLDVETTAIEEFSMFAPKARMRLIQFGSLDTAWVLDPHSEWRRDIVQQLYRTTIRPVSHTNYDSLWCRREFGVVLDYIDTLTLARLIEPDERKRNDLKTLTQEYLDDELVKAEAALHAEFKRLAPVGQRVGTKPESKLMRWGFNNIPIDNEFYKRYAGLDAIYVRRVLDKLGKRFGPHPKFSELSRREQVIRRQADAMQWRGMLIDVEYTKRILYDIESEYMEADDAIMAATGIRPKSPKMAVYLESVGVEFYERTPGGNGKLDKENLPGLIERNAGTVGGVILTHLATISKNQNLLNNLRIMLRAADIDGLVHPQIKTCAAITGRMSITKPAMQTFKKDDPRLRGCYLARPGYVLVGADYDGQEYRLGLAFSGEPMYRRLIDENLSPHDLTAELIFGKGWPKIPRARDKAKVLNFLQQYEGGPKAIVRQLGIPQDEAVQLWKAWRNAYRVLTEWSGRMAKHTVVVNPWGRRIPRDRFRPYANGNYMIQSSGRDLLGDATVRLIEAGYGEYLWLWVHDEIILEVPEAMAEQAVKELSECMRAELNGVEFTATAKIIGTRWSGQEAA